MVWLKNEPKKKSTVQRATFCHLVGTGESCILKRQEDGDESKKAVKEIL